MKIQSVMKLLAVMMSAQLVMTGCASAGSGSVDGSAVSQAAADSAAGDADTAQTEEGLLVKLEDLDLEDQFSDRDQDASYDKTTATSITLQGDNASMPGTMTRYRLCSPAPRSLPGRTRQFW